MNKIQEAIAAYRKTYIQRKPGGTIKALSEMLNKSPRMVNYYIVGAGGWTEEMVKIIQDATKQRTNEA